MMTAPVIDERAERVHLDKTETAPARTFYGVRDIGMNYWRGRLPCEEGGTADREPAPLDSVYAWTRDTTDRAEFSRRRGAERELARIVQWREQHPAPSPTARPRVVLMDPAVMDKACY